MTKALPKKLKKEPLLDAIFEVRFSGSSSASVVLPGALFSKIQGIKSVEQLPIAELPKAMRDADPNLKYSPLSRLDWGKFFINVGDFSLSINCKHPYPGWEEFKPAIIKVIEAFSGSGVSATVDRYSLKYIDMLSASDDRQKVSMINFDVTMAGHKLEEEPFHIRIEIPRDGLKNIVQVISAAQATLHTGIKREGIIIDVDTVATFNAITLEKLLGDFSDKLDVIHHTNKAMFFDCIMPSTLKSLEPVYE